MTLADAVSSDLHNASPCCANTVIRPALRWPVLLAAVAVTSCGGDRPGPDEEIRRWIDAAVAEAEARDRGSLMARVARGYVDARGNDYERVGNLLRYYFLRPRNVALLTRIEEIVVSGDTAAEVRMTVGMAGAGGSAGLTADAYRFLLELEKPEDEWLLMQATWGRLGEELR